MRRGGGVWGGAVPLPNMGWVWGGAVPPPRIFFLNFYPEMAHFYAFCSSNFGVRENAGHRGSHGIFILN